MAVLLETSLGNIAIDLYTEDAPQECLNFLKLCKMKYYNFCLIHRVLKNFVAQTGDPTGTGQGGESIFGLLNGPAERYFPRNPRNRLKHAKFGTISMVNDGQDRHGSQFIITLGPNQDSLNGQHAVFGEVAEESHDVLRAINDTYCDDTHHPYRDIRVRHTIILDDPFDDPPGLRPPASSPIPTKEQLETGRLRDDEDDLGVFDGMSAEEIDKAMAKRLAKAQATVLEMVGDIPDADVKPPDNVLFVCKLNPVTSDDDLHTIFSRFGKILSCEVIRDFKTGESLSYAFVEFESEESAVEAYFKMGNVLIDDRRIHVDFSQSVAKLNYHIPKQYQRGGNDSTELIVKRRRGEQVKGDKYAMVFDEGDLAHSAHSHPHRHQHKRSDHREESKRKRSKSPDRDHGRPAKQQDRHRSDRDQSHGTREPHHHRSSSSRDDRSSHSSEHRRTDDRDRGHSHQSHRSSRHA